MITTRLFALSVVIGCLCIATSLEARTPSFVADSFENFRYRAEVQFPEIVVPTVVEIDMGVGMDPEGAVLVKSDRAIVHTLPITTGYSEPLSVDALSGVDTSAMHDGAPDTYADFPFQNEGEQTATFTLRSAEPVSADGMKLILDDNVSTPTRIGVSAVEQNGLPRIVVASRPFNGTALSFPETFSAEWIITLNYNQPLRIAEVDLARSSAYSRTNHSIRFLAEPGESYLLFIDPAHGDTLPAPVGERPDLSVDRDLALGFINAVESNPHYRERQYDSDEDGVHDGNDNCVTEPNSDQLDVDENGTGDACDDFDRDGYSGALDNCPLATNRMQADSDKDGEGDACDTYDNRFTERNAWVPWLGIGFAALMLAVLIALSLKGKEIARAE